MSDIDVPALRPETPDDEPFLLAVYAGTRDEELEQVAWTTGQRAAFVRMQFEAQRRCYRERYPRAAFSVIAVGGKDAGRLCVNRDASEIRIVDIALLPAFRGRGIGTRLLEALLAEARARGVPLRIHVEKFNRALGLYRRMGFVPLEDRGVYWFMEARPA
jgi:ribosomal protein S18 acetylase RimI-like enzyme